MANVKISQLPSGSVPTDNDIIPMTDFETLTTVGVNTKNLLTYVTSSNFGKLIVLGSASLEQTTFGDNVRVTGSVGVGTSLMLGANGASLQSDGVTNRVSSTGIIRSDNGFWIGGTIAAWDTTGIIFQNSSAKAWLRQAQTANGFSDARIIGNAFASGSVASRAGSTATDAQGALSSSLFVISTDALQTITASDKWIFTGQQVLGPQGTAVSASYSFINDRNTGLYQPSQNILGITTQGMQVAQFSQFGMQLTGSLTASVPAFISGAVVLGNKSPSNFVPTNGGSMYMDQNGNLAFGLNGSNQFSVGSGVWSTSLAMQLNGTLRVPAGSINGPSLFSSADTTSGFYFLPNQISAEIAGSERVRITANGISLGTTSFVPSASVHLSGTVEIDGPLYGFSSAYNNLTGNYVLTNADNGKVISINAPAQSTVTAPLNLTGGFGVTIFQVGTGPLLITGAAGVTTLNRQGQFRTAGQYAVTSLIYVSGNAYIVAGDTQV